MKIVIDIQEEQYEFIKQSMTMDKVKDYHALLYAICEYIKNGTPLPKGHGGLIDEKEVKKMIEEAKVNSEHSKTFCENIIKIAPTIIEADKEESEKV